MADDDKKLKDDDVSQVVSGGGSLTDSTSVGSPYVPLPSAQDVTKAVAPPITSGTSINVPSSRPIPRMPPSSPTDNYPVLPPLPAGDHPAGSPAPTVPAAPPVKFTPTFQYTPDAAASVGPPPGAASQKPVFDLINQQRQAMMPYYDRVMKAEDASQVMVDSIFANKPKIPELKPFQPPKPTSMWEAWGSPAMIMAGMMGMKGGGQALTRSLTAAAAVNNAIKAKDDQAYKRAFDEWNQESENAIKHYNMEHASYEDALKYAKSKPETALAMAETAAHVFDNSQMIQAVQHGLDEANKVAKQQWDWNVEMAKHRGEILKEHEQTDYYNEFAQRPEMAGKSKMEIKAAADAHLKQVASGDSPKDKGGVYAAVYNAEIRNGKSEVEAAQAATDATSSSKESVLREAVIAENERRESAGLAPMTPQEVGAFRQVYAPSSGGASSKSVIGNLLSDDARMLEASNRLFHNKYPPWLRAPEDRARIDNDASALARSLGMSMKEATVLPEQVKADASALLKDIGWLDGIKRGQKIIEGQIPIAKSYLDKLDLTEIRTINAGILAGKTEFGSADANNYANAMSTLAFEWGRLQAGPQSAAMLPVEVVKIGMNRVQNVTPDQFVGEAELLQKEAANTIKASEDTVKERRQALVNRTATSPVPGKFDHTGLFEATSAEGKPIYRVSPGKWVNEDGTPYGK